jgi:hypothetical protein
VLPADDSTTAEALPASPGINPKLAHTIAIAKEAPRRLNQSPCDMFSLLTDVSVGETNKMLTKPKEPNPECPSLSKSEDAHIRGRQLQTNFDRNICDQHKPDMQTTSTDTDM